MMSEAEFPPFVKNLTEAQVPFRGLKAWFMKSGQGQMVFHQAEEDISTAEHFHDYQWGVVLNGRIDFILDGQTLVCNRGDTYVIPAGANHRAKIYSGFRSVDYFEDPEHYQAKGTGVGI